MKLIVLNLLIGISTNIYSKSISCPYELKAMPLEEYSLAGSFNERRVTRAFHVATDLNTSFGSKIMAIDSGFVKYIERGSNVKDTSIIILHKNGIASSYSHIDPESIPIKLLNYKYKDIYIKAGDVIGEVGNFFNGNSNGKLVNHLHFQLFDTIKKRFLNASGCFQSNDHFNPVIKAIKFFQNGKEVRFNKLSSSIALEIMLSAYDSDNFKNERNLFSKFPPYKIKYILKDSNEFTVIEKLFYQADSISCYTCFNIEDFLFDGETGDLRSVYFEKYARNHRDRKFRENFVFPLKTLTKDLMIPFDNSISHTDLTKPLFLKPGNYSLEVKIWDEAGNNSNRYFPIKVIN